MREEEPLGITSREKRALRGGVEMKDEGGRRR